MFPISDSIKTNKLQVVTIFIIALNIYVFARQLLSSDIEQFILNFALVPSQVDITNPSTLIPFLTSMFLHGGFFHIFTNMWFLWIFGDNVEAYFGYVFFVLVYIVSGLVGNFLQFIISSDSPIPMLGASGAISGVLGAYYILFPHSKIKSLLILIFFVTIIDIPALIWLFYWFFLQLFQGIAGFGVSTQTTGGIAFWAHVGGFVTGVAAAEISKRLRNDKGYIEGETVR